MILFIVGAGLFAWYLLLIKLEVVRMNFSIEIEDQKLECSGILCEHRSGNLRRYDLSGLASELMSFARKSINEKSYFNCVVKRNDSIIFTGGHCFFYKLNATYKTGSIVVNWVTE